MEGNNLLDQLQDVIAFIITQDAPDLPESQQQTLAGHLTGAVYVTMRKARLERPETITQDARIDAVGQLERSKDWLGEPQGDDF